MAKRQISDDECYSEPSHKQSTRKRTKVPHSNGRAGTHAPGSHAASIHIIISPTSIQQALLDWFVDVRDSRGMPWRKQYDPTLGPDGRAQRAYEVWVSEIMLQQTQVATVIPYYNKWMERFPSISDLAASDIETVNALWKGLGYYSRATRLLTGAKKAARELGGRLPDNAVDMEAKIPGIGRYSAGAICSIAYNQCVPVLDGNVNRLLSRLLALHAPPKSKSTLDVLWSGATSMVEGTERPGDLNQALIELGSTVCKVRDPGCPDCPLQAWCKAYQMGKDKGEGSSSNNPAQVIDIEDVCTLCAPSPAGAPVTVYPMKAERKKAREELDIVNVIEWQPKDHSDRYFLLVRRPERGLLAGLYEFPTSANVSSTISDLREIPHTLLSVLLVSPPQPYVQKGGTRLEEDPGIHCLNIVSVKPAGDIVHIFSHIRKTYRVQWVLMVGGNEPPELCVGGMKAKLGGKKRQVKGVDENGRNMNDDPTAVPLATMWTPLDKVEDANVGTGMLKVWNQVKILWEVTS